MNGLDGIGDNLPEILAMIFFGSIVATIVHEVGHMTAGLMVGLKFPQVGIASSLLPKGGFNFKFLGVGIVGEKRGSLVAFMRFREQQVSLFQDFIFTLGGPLASVGLSVGLLMLIDNNAMVRWFAIANLIGMGVNMFPIGLKSVDMGTDGWFLVQHLAEVVDNLS